MKYPRIDQSTMAALWSNDSYAKRYSSLEKSHPKLFTLLMNFFDDERHHSELQLAINVDVPALAMVVKELENTTLVNEYLSDKNKTPQDTLLFRQAVGVMVRIVMVGMYGWKTTGRKGSLGIRGDKLDPKINKSGISKYFTSAEIYEPPYK